MLLSSSSPPPPMADLPRPPNASRPPRRWLPDSASAVCMHAGCGKEFTAVVRRHHCRRCGFVVCATCSGRRAPAVPLGGVPRHKLSSSPEQRTCEACWARMGEENRLRAARAGIAALEGSGVRVTEEEMRASAAGGQPLGGDRLRLAMLLLEVERAPQPAPQLLPGARPGAEEFEAAGTDQRPALADGTEVRLRWVDRASNTLFEAQARWPLFGSGVREAIEFRSPGAGRICLLAKRGPPVSDDEWPDFDMRGGTAIDLGAVPTDHVYTAGSGAAALDLCVDTEMGVPVAVWL